MDSLKPEYTLICIFKDDRFPYITIRPYENGDIQGEWVPIGDKWVGKIISVGSLSEIKESSREWWIDEFEMRFGLAHKRCIGE